MAYVEGNPRTKKALREMVASRAEAGRKVYVYQPGPFGPAVRAGSVALEGPHSPEPHRWYASAKVDDDGAIVPGSVK